MHGLLRLRAPSEDTAVQAEMQVKELDSKSFRDELTMPTDHLGVRHCDERRREAAPSRQIAPEMVM